MKRGDTLSIVPSVAGGAPAGDDAGMRQGRHDAATEHELPALSADEIKRYSRHLIMPEVGIDGQRRLKAGSVLCIGAGGLGSPAAMYLAAAGIGRIGIVDFDVVDFSNLQRQLLHGTATSAAPSSSRRKRRLQRPQPARPDRHLRDGADVRERARSVQRLRRHPRRHRQLPDALPGQRRLRADRQAERLRQHLPLRGAGVGVRDQGRPVLPLPLPRAAAARTGAELRRGRRARRAARHHRRHPGDRDGQADSRHRRAADRPLHDLRRAEDELPRAEAAEGSGLPGVRHASDGHQADRLRAVLRHPARAAGGRAREHRERVGNHPG